MMRKSLILIAVILLLGAHILSVESAVEEILPPVDEPTVEVCVEIPEVTVEEGPLFEYGTKIFGTLEIERLILTPYETPDKVGVTFSRASNETVEITVLDTNNRIVNSNLVVAREDVGLGYVYKSVFSGLSYETTYRYVISKGDQFSHLYTFKTLPEEGPITMAFFGDTQGYKMSQYEAFLNTYERAKKEAEDIDLTYIAGDIVDDGGALNQWGYFDAAIEAYAPGHLWLTTIGNHDVKNTSDPYKASFNYPKNGLEGLEERTYFIDVPGVRIIAWDTESYSRFEEQSAWLKEVCAVDTMTIVLMHRSVYPMSYNEAYIRTLAPLFEDVGVDLVLSGHDHVYNRTTMKEGVKAPLSEGVTYIVGGTSTGSKYYADDYATSRYWRDVVYDDNNPVFVMVEINGTTIDFKSYAVIDGISSLVDEGTIEKN